MADFSLNEKEQKELLSIARKTLEKFFKKESLLEIQSILPSLQEKVGAFVTLSKGEELRGCIGHIVSNLPLFETVKRLAIAAATEDSRFDSVTLEELKEIEIEISVLTPFKKIQTIEEIKIGVHGLLITQGKFRGLLLPQVATEYQWNREEFLNHTCLKAGLSEEAWKDPKTQIEIFSAQVFQESSSDLP